jgi:hypothetical protein
MVLLSLAIFQIIPIKIIFNFKVPGIGGIILRYEKPSESVFQKADKYTVLRAKRQEEKWEDGE